MRLCIIDPFTGLVGPAWFCNDLFVEPIADGTSVLILRTRANEGDESLERNRCEVRMIRHTGAIPPLRDWRRWLRYPHAAVSAATAIIKVLREFRPTLIVSNTELNILAGVLARVFGVPSIARIHAQTLGRHGRIGRLYARGIARVFDALLCNSNSTARYLADLGVPASRLVVLENSVDTERFRPGAPTIQGRSELGATLSDFLVICVAHHSPIKGVHVLIDAFEQFAQRHEDVHLALVGTTTASVQRSYSDSLYARVLGSAVLRQCVTFHKPNSRIHQVFPQADVVVQPSLSEAFGRTAAEASSCGIPVIASDVGGLSEIIVNGRTGWLVPPGDAGALANALTEAYLDPAGRKERGQAGVEHVGRYRSGLIAPKFMQICSSICQNHAQEH